MADTKAKITIGAFLGRFGSAGIAYLATTIDFFALTLALPSMAAELGTTTTSLQWTASGYMIATGVSMIPGSRIADLVGRRRVLLFGVAIFGLASLWVGLSTSVESVVAARIVQGLGAGLIFPAMMSVISNSTTPAERPKVLGMIGALAGLGTALGPVLGGGLSSTVGWRWVFFFNVPLAAVAFVWGHFQLKDSKDPALSGKRIRNLDFVGTFLIAAGVVGISLGIDNAGAGALAALAPLAVGVVAVAVLFVWERRSSWPLITQDLLRNGRYKALVLAATVGNMGALTVAVGGIAVVIAATILQSVGGAKVDQQAITVTLLSAAAATAVFAVIFGVAEWKEATLVTSKVATSK